LRRAALALGLAVVLAGCGDDGDVSTGNDLPADDSLADAPTTTEGDGSEPDDGADCPFDAEQISEALDEDLESVAGDGTGEDGGSGTICLFVEDGGEPGPGSFTVTVTGQPGELADVAERFEDSSASQYQELPVLGDDAVVAFLETSSTPETDDIIYQADLYSEGDDEVLVVSLLGFSNEDDRDAAVDAVAQLLAG
jgi:hypothetical protein